MKDTSRHAGETRDRILEAASHLFAEKGFRGATVALICRQAKANIAAVNYHFGGKERLYQEAWRHAHRRLLEQNPPDGGVPPDRPAAERLHGRIRAGLLRAFHADGVEFRIMRAEMINPTGLLRQVMHDAIQPLRQATQSILRELLGPGASDFDVQLCEACLVAPWIHISHHQQAKKHEGMAPVFHEEDLDAMTEHMTAYALAGIEAIRRRIQASGGRIHAKR
ncbi:MAG TPA: CerR family C-terminal domain-containing protein [Candidatus Brocadiia bacterium]|nr:CerR family C-terminal domain-containing protein [Candidatus Brocadiia bacterium]